MTIIQLLFDNFRGGNVSLPFPMRPPIQGEYRGLLKNKTEECTGCALCAYVCTSSAVGVERNTEGFVWNYDAAHCTFCARCVQRCPKKALSMQSKRPPVYRRRGELRQSLAVKKKPAAKPAAAVAAASAETSAVAQ